jgi:hypothetical protein
LCNGDALDRILVLDPRYLYAIDVVGIDMNYRGYQRVLRRNADTQRITAKIEEVAEEAIGPLAELPEQKRLLVLRTINELTDSLLTVKFHPADDEIGVVSPI